MQMNLSKSKPAILSYQELVHKCSLVGMIDDSVNDLWKLCTPLPAGNKRILFPHNFLKWAEQAKLYL
jgi:hypothetical protein